MDPPAQTNKKKPKKLHPFLGGLKNGQEVVPPFFPKEFLFSQNPQKPYFYSVSRKKGGGHLLLKERPVLKGGYF